MKARTAGIFAIGLIIRLACVLWAEYQDRTMPVKYTDVDYDVYTDASREILQGNSPFDRTTYRYTPILAYMLLPNVYLHEAWGKLLFVASDMIVGYGLAVHFKIYPIVYALSFLVVRPCASHCIQSSCVSMQFLDEDYDSSIKPIQTTAGVAAKAWHWLNRTRLAFGLISGGVFVVLTAGFYLM
ncbi:hypothetical protein B5M09_003099 [Aphanomyces astaci]|uniref:GPI mannosyltransferase 1 n=1 Tax=Aphanomyces astaci TaxID=112090 RepID=A0A3R7Y9P3_APHAT|nr:hypothetical protein B5M09_003099 [Aphanomyces astaci]